VGFRWIEAGILFILVDGFEKQESGFEGKQLQFVL
jgi:hypothetical protein